MSEEVETRTYEIETSGEGKFRVTVPATYKVTFGAVVPASAKSAATSYNSGGWGLRFWEAQDRQRAVFSNVVSFRDVSIPILRAAVRKFGSQDWYVDTGQFEAGECEHDWKPDSELKPPEPPEVAEVPFRTFKRA